MKGPIIIILLIALLFTQATVFNLQRQVRYYKEEAAKYQLAYERKCAQCPIIDNSNYPYVLKK